jgi:hypothetical protein
MVLEVQPALVEVPVVLWTMVVTHLVEVAQHLHPPHVNVLQLEQFQDSKEWHFILTVMEIQHKSQFLVGQELPEPLASVDNLIVL